MTNTIYQRYRIEREVRRTATGAIYEAIDDFLGCRVTLLEWFGNHASPYPILTELNLDPDAGEYFSTGNSFYLAVPEGPRGLDTLRKLKAVNALPTSYLEQPAPASITPMERAPEAPRAPTPNSLPAAAQPVRTRSVKSPLLWVAAALCSMVVGFLLIQNFRQQQDTQVLVQQRPVALPQNPFTSQNTPPAAQPSAQVPKDPAVQEKLPAEPRKTPARVPPPAVAPAPANDSPGPQGTAPADQRRTGSDAEHPPANRETPPAESSSRAPASKTPSSSSQDTTSPAPSPVLPPTAPPAASPVQQASNTPPVSILRPVEPSPAPLPVPQRAPSKLEGTMTWSGEFERSGAVILLGSSSSSGELRGDPLPGQPVTVDIVPRDLAVAESPAARNGWTRLVLRSAQKRRIVVTIHWRLVQ